MRLYTWRPDALSLGYFQRYADVPATERASAVVRRLTGGGAIHHVAELTFSIAAPQAHPLYRGAVSASYERVHEILREALGRVGVRASARGERPLASDRAETGLCFHHSTALDLAWGGAKGVGSAQRRARGRVLHHGSIKLGPSPVETGIACVDPAGEGPAPEELGEVLCAVLASRAGARLEAGEPADDELLHAYRRADFFASDEFVRRR